MSALLPPRLVIQGHVSWSPNTINNSPAAYDKRLVAAGACRTEWLKGLNEDGTDICGGWNLYGANDCAFVGVAVTRIQTDRGAGCTAAARTTPGHDPLLGCPVTLAGSRSPLTAKRGPVRIVDVDPKHPITAQLFFDRFTLGDSRCGFTGRPYCRSCVRWPVLNRNLNQTGGLIRAGCAAVLWQTGLVRESLRWSGIEHSPGLRVLKETLEADAGHRGLVVRFINYRTLYYQSAVWKGVQLTNPELLSAAYRDGFTGLNPARSLTLGSIGIWRSEELATAPVERLLLPGRRAAGYLSPEFSDRASVSEACPQAVLGPAFVALDHDRQVAAVDFGLTFPERNIFLDKADLGMFQLQARRGRQCLAIGRPINPADYGREAYEANAGVLELPLPPDACHFARQARLEMVCALSKSRDGDPPRRQVVLREEPLVADSEERGIYLDQGLCRRVHIHVFERGEPLGRPACAKGTAPAAFPHPLPLTQGPYSLVFAHYADDGRPLLRRRQVVRLVAADGKPLRQDRAPLDPGGTVQIGLWPLRPGFCFLSFRPCTGARRRLPVRFSTAKLPYLAVRVLPFDDDLARQTPDSELTFDFVYNHVLRVYDFVYPAMNQTFALNDPQSLVAENQMIRAHLLLDPATSTEYWPASRDLSAGKRRLLLRFLEPGSRSKSHGGDQPFEGAHR
jgi:hypothetical protein